MILNARAKIPWLFYPHFRYHLPLPTVILIENTNRCNAPGAMVFATGSAEEMIANCDLLITHFSSTAFVGLALGKETYSDFSMDEMRRLMPVQHGLPALNIANVCRRVLEED